MYVIFQYDHFQTLPATELFTVVKLCTVIALNMSHVIHAQLLYITSNSY